MLLSGGEVSRVEDTISRILKSYGVERVEVFTILSFISLTAVFEEDRVLTENRRVSIVAYSNDFTRLEQLNALSRELCATRPDLDMMAEKLESIDLPPRKKQFRELYWLLGYILSGTGFAIFFGGTWRDALGAGLCCRYALAEAALAAGYAHSLGLTGDGRVLAAGNDEYGQCDVSD